MDENCGAFCENGSALILIFFFSEVVGMRNLLNFLLKYDYWLLFVLLEVVSFILLFRFNSYQGSVFFTSANRVAGSIYEVANEITSYFGLHTVNRDLVRRNVELELQVESLNRALKGYMRDTTEVEKSMYQNVLADYSIYPAEVVNNSLTHVDNYITINKGDADSIRTEMGVVSGNGVVGIVYQTSAHYAIVLPVLNSKSSISCKIQRTDYFGSLKWNGGSSLYAWLKDIPRHSEFSLGDTVVTSGHSAVFPEGIPVGVVDDMADSHDGLSYVLKVKLFTDFARLNDVNVISFRGRPEQSELENNIK